jgi:hypothetical protein
MAEAAMEAEETEAVATVEEGRVAEVRGEGAEVVRVAEVRGEEAEVVRAVATEEAAMAEEARAEVRVAGATEVEDSVKEVVEEKAQAKAEEVMVGLAAEETGT